MKPALACLAIAVAAAAEAATFRAHVSDAIGADRVMLRLQQVTSSGDVDLQAEPRILALPVDGTPARAELPDGYWVAIADTDGVWSARHYLASGDDVTVELSRAKTIVGVLATDDGQRVSDVGAQFSDKPADVSVCGIDDEAFRCVVPATAQSIRLRARGYIAHTLPIGERNDAGTLRLKRGQSIFGRVTIGRGVRADVGHATVRARPGNTNSAAFTAKPAANGSFHIDGVPPGEYVLSAEAPSRLTSEELLVTVVAGGEAELARPLVLDQPHRITLAIAPAMAPGDIPWDVTVSRSMSEERLESVTSSAASRDGEWSARLRPASYHLTISSGEARWSEQEVVLDSDLTLPISIPMRTLRGRVLHGDAPLEARVQLSTRESSVETTSDGDGRFEIVVRALEDATWEARVTADAPAIERTIAGVKLPAGDGELTIHLPKTVLNGTVVDATGTPRPSAMVNVIGAAGTVELIQLYTDDEGRFATHALERGTYSIHADDGVEQSDTMRVEIRDDDATEVRLALRAGREVRGRVVSAFGPVAGANVSIRAVDVPDAIITSRVTDERGDFHFVLPPNAAELDVRVAPPGFAYTIGRVQWHPKKPLIASVDQRGGTIVVRGPEHATLHHAGATEPVAALRYRWRTIARDDGATIIEAMEPGGYALCDGGRCVEGFLPPYGELTLALGPSP